MPRVSRCAGLPVEAAEVEALLALSDERDRWLARVIDAHRAGFDSGRAEPGGYLDGHALGYDHGLGARQDARAFIRGVIEGYSAGLAERHRWVSKLLGRAERAGSGGPCPLCGEYPRPRRAAAVARVRPQERGEEKHGQAPVRAVAS